jgi:hypothetical protein
MHEIERSASVGFVGGTGSSCDFGTDCSCGFGCIGCGDTGGTSFVGCIDTLLIKRERCLQSRLFRILGYITNALQISLALYQTTPAVP